jgi:gliding motility-associated-like protein
VRLNNYDANGDGFNRGVTDGTIQTANSLFYHSLAQINGIEYVDLSIYHIPNDDGVWTSVANWKNSWNNIQGGGPMNSGNFSIVNKNAWNISGNDHPYILVNLEDAMEIPNIFTPNNDGVNDQFLVDAKNLSEFNLVIVNRWGQVVFDTNDINQSWDGKYKNEMCNEGTYFYVATGKSLNNQEYKKQGFVQLEY